MRRILLAFAALASPLAASAQENLEWAAPSPPPSAQGPVTGIPDDPAFVPFLPDDPEVVPVDGGLLLLAAAGAGLAAKRMRNRRRPQSEDESAR